MRSTMFPVNEQCDEYLVKGSEAVALNLSLPVVYIACATT